MAKKQPRMRPATMYERLAGKGQEMAQSLAQQPLVRAAGMVGNIVDEGVRGNTRGVPGWKVGAMPFSPAPKYIPLQGEVRASDELIDIASRHTLKTRPAAPAGTTMQEYAAGKLYRELMADPINTMSRAALMAEMQNAIKAINMPLIERLKGQLQWMSGHPGVFRPEFEARQLLARK